MRAHYSPKEKSPWSRDRLEITGVLGAVKGKIALCRKKGHEGGKKGKKGSGEGGTTPPPK